MKSWNNKSKKVMDNLSQLYPYLWNQCTLPLKNCLKTHPKYKVAEKVKDAVQLWIMIEETYNSTSTIDSAQQRVLKADLNLKSVYGENMDLSEYYDVLLLQSKVVWVAGVNFGSEVVAGLIQAKLHAKDSSALVAPGFCESLVKLEPNMSIDNLWKIVDYNTACRRWYDSHLSFWREQT